VELGLRGLRWKSVGCRPLLAASCGSTGPPSPLSSGSPTKSHPFSFSPPPSFYGPPSILLCSRTTYSHSLSVAHSLSHPPSLQVKEPTFIAVCPASHTPSRFPTLTPSSLRRAGQRSHLLRRVLRSRQAPARPRPAFCYSCLQSRLQPGAGDGLPSAE